MNIELDQNGTSCVAIIKDPDYCLIDTSAALDLLGNVSFNLQCDKMLLRKEQLPEAFFQLSTGLAGEILQKYTNYGMKLAIVGDFTQYDSKSLRDFIWESNRRKQILFLPDEATALATLHELP